jgi:glycosyltransferase involved in cell wall biosynthesis
VTTPARILYLHTTSEVGGSDVSLVRLIEGLDRSRYQALVLLPSDGPLVSRLRDAGAEVRISPRLRKLTSRRGWGYLFWWAICYPSAVWWLRGVIRRERIALVHTNTIHNLYGGPASWLARVPHVWHVREIVWQKGWLRRLELWMTRRMASRIVATSEAVAGMYGPPGARPSSLVIISNGVETDRFTPGEAPAVRLALGGSDDTVLIGLVCRLDVWKGVETFLDAAALVAADCPAARFAVVGGAIVGLEAYGAALRQRASALALGDRLVWTSWTYGPAAMPDVHRALDMVVLASSEPEPFGLVVVEAMASARPVVATAHGGPCELVEPGSTGLLVPPSDPAAMAAAIRRLIDDPALAARMGAAGRVRAVEHYSAHVYVSRVLALYDDVCAQRGAA